MGEIVLYHGSFNKVVVPQYGLGETKHDYGKGFYLTENVELAKEWAVCRPDETNGWVHKFELDTKDLKVLDFQQYNVLLTGCTLLHPEFLPYSPHISAAAVLRFPESEMQSSFLSP